jgi:uncharacterized membrane protein
MSTLSLLPLIKVSDGVQTGEDWQLSIAFYLDDGVTPIDISGLSFSLTVGSIATLTEGASQLVISGPSNNVLVITALAAQTATWPTAVYQISLVTTDGVNTRDIFAYSTLAVGAPQSARVTMIVAPDVVPISVAAPVSSALSAAFQALQPTAIASALASLSGSELSALMQALISSLATASGSTAPVTTGQAFINSSGYVVIAQ